MSTRIQIVFTLIVVAIVAGLAWLWYERLELRWETRARLSEAATENRMLGATLLLRQRGHTVSLAGSLGALDLGALPAGTLIVGNENGTTAPETAQLLLAWIRRGNTLVTSPRWSSTAERAAFAASLGQAANDDTDAGGDDDEDNADGGAAPAEETKAAPVDKVEAQRKRRPAPALV